MKLSLIYDSLTPESQAFVNKFVDSSDGFLGLLRNLLSQIPEINKYERYNRHINNSWVGTRMEVELPVVASELNTE